MNILLNIYSVSIGQALRVCTLENILRAALCRRVCPDQLTMALAAGDSLDLLEVCPQGLGLAGELAKRVTAEGGAALVIDYGRDQPYADSLQAIKDHSFVPVLSQPGLADLSAHVDFSALKYVNVYAC